ncbi:MAG: hypothetical protein ACJAUV_001224 [Flavobacteriales bacterium]|jgi:hypothetical protein
MKQKKLYKLKKYIYFISFTLISSTALAQTFDAGVFVGITASQISGDELAGFHQPGLNLGAEITTTYKNDWTVGFGIFFNQKGSRATSNNVGSKAFYILRLNYLDVPLIIGKTINKWHFGAGPSINVMTSSTEADFFGTNEILVPFNRFELSGLVQVSYQMKKNLAVRLNYGHSITPVRNFAGNSYLNGQFNEWLTTGLLYML